MIGCMSNRKNDFDRICLDQSQVIKKKVDPELNIPSRTHFKEDIFMI